MTKRLISKLFSSSNPGIYILISYKKIIKAFNYNVGSWVELKIAIFFVFLHIRMMSYFRLKSAPEGWKIGGLWESSHKVSDIYRDWLISNSYFVFGPKSSRSRLRHFCIVARASSSTFLGLDPLLSHKSSSSLPNPRRVWQVSQIKSLNEWRSLKRSLR